MRACRNLAALALLAASAVQAHAQTNVLVIVADDVSPEVIGAYGEGIDPAPTPNLDALARRGVLFRNAWSSPVCSPTRATIMTGRHGFRTGVGFLVDASEHELDDDEVYLPAALRSGPGPFRYATGAIGKWHLGDGPSGPTDRGFDHFVGNLISLNSPPNQGYYQWQRVDNGQVAISTVYNTTAVVDDALDFMTAAPEPWFAYVAFNAAHFPYDDPPPGLHSQNLGGNPNLRVHYKAVVEAMDTEIGRMLARLGPGLLSRTQILFVGDNGVPQDVAVPPIAGSKAKGTVYQGGIRVPLIAAGPLVGASGSESQALVHTCDLYATVLDIAGIDPAAVGANGLLDSVSFVPSLQNPSAAGAREFLFSEVFFPNGQPFGLRADTMRDRRYKALWLTTGVEFYDLWTDPFELNDLLQGPLTPPQALAFSRLARERAALLSSEPEIVGKK